MISTQTTFTCDMSDETVASVSGTSSVGNPLPALPPGWQVATLTIGQKSSQFLVCPNHGIDTFTVVALAQQVPVPVPVTPPVVEPPITLAPTPASLVGL